VDRPVEIGPDTVDVNERVQTKLSKPVLECKSLPNGKRLARSLMTQRTPSSKNRALSARSTP
jgi:hypothetical protein